MDAKYRIKSKYKNVSVIQRNDLEWAVIDDNKNIIVPFGKYGWIEGFDENGLSRVRTEKIKDIAIQLETSDEEVECLKSASNLNGNLNCSKELEHYAS